jgi:hypothetical protein
MTDPIPVRLIIDNAEVMSGPLDDSEGAARGNLPPASEGGLPPDFPVTPLGQSLTAKGELLNHYLDPSRRLRSLKDEKHGRLMIVGLLGEHQDVLERYWPRRSKVNAGKRAGGADEERWVVSGWHPDAVARALISACARKGTIDLTEQRGGQIDRRAAADLGDDRLPGEAFLALDGEDLTGQFNTGHREAPLQADPRMSAMPMPISSQKLGILDRLTAASVRPAPPAGRRSLTGTTVVAIPSKA